MSHSFRYGFNDFHRTDESGSVPNRSDVRRPSLWGGPVGSGEAHLRPVRGSEVYGEPLGSPSYRASYTYCSGTAKRDGPSPTGTHTPASGTRLRGRRRGPDPE